MTDFITMTENGFITGNALWGKAKSSPCLFPTNRTVVKKHMLCAGVHEKK